MMQTIIPVSDMRFYNDSLKNVNPGSEVVLTKNGKAVYKVVDFQEHEEMKATLELLSELQKGKISLATEPVYSIEDFEKEFGIE